MILNCVWQYGFVTRVTSLVVVKPAANDSTALQETPVRPVPADVTDRDADNIPGNNKFSESKLAPLPLTLNVMF